MPNIIGSILRIYGSQEERNKFVEYIKSRNLYCQANRSLRYEYDKETNTYTSIGPEKHEIRDPLLLYDFYCWENDLGTFMVFSTFNNTLSRDEGYTWHENFPTLKIIYRAIDEGWPDHRESWEVNPDLNESDVKTMRLANKFQTIMSMAKLCYQISGNKNKFEKAKADMMQMVNNDPNEYMRILNTAMQFQKIDSLDSLDDDGNLFVLSPEEKVNYDYEPREATCEGIYRSWRGNW